jgi:hypothetical protein
MSIQLQLELLQQQQQQQAQMQQQQLAAAIAAIQQQAQAQQQQLTFQFAAIPGSQPGVLQQLPQPANLDLSQLMSAQQSQPSTLMGLSGHQAVQQFVVQAQASGTQPVSHHQLPAMSPTTIQYQFAPPASTQPSTQSQGGVTLGLAPQLPTLHPPQPLQQQQQQQQAQHFSSSMAPSSTSIRNVLSQATASPATASGQQQQLPAALHFPLSHQPTHTHQAPP